MSLFPLFSSLDLACLLLEAQKLVMTEPGPSFINVFFTLFSSLASACLLLEAQKLVMTEPGPSFINVFFRVIQLVSFSLPLTRSTKARYH